MNLRLVLGGLLAAAVAAHAEVKVASIFTDNGVLQQGMAVPVWGTADAGEQVMVSFGDQKKTTKADANGAWMVKLSKLKASAEGQTLTVNSLALTNVLVGEVWICSGQSNMEFPLLRASNGKEAVAASADPLLRVFLVKKATSLEPLKDVSGSWMASNSNTVPGFSAVGYFFGRDLRAARKVPVGLIGTYWGGTPAEAWTKPSCLAKNPLFSKMLADHERAIQAKGTAEEKQKHEAEMAKWKEAVAKAKAEGKPAPKAPRTVESGGLDPHSPGVLYNAMIAPLVPYAIRGATWYQGESNAARAKEYETLLPTMIQNWRDDFDVGAFPFLLVQISTFQGQPPTIREAQLHIARKTKNTAMVVSVDVGNEKDIHPTAKEPVGQRLALAARDLAYDEECEFEGPVFTKMKTDGSKAILTFDEATGGLVAKDGELKNFVIAEKGTTNFVPAIAKIIAPTKIEVSAEAVKIPGAVRYGWANYFVADLFDNSGLPASPFRTDDQ